MSYPFRRILCPIDFDDNSMAALDVAVRMANDSGGTILLAHVVPMIIPPTGMPVYVDMYKGQEDAAREKLREIAERRLHKVGYELVVNMGEPAGSILRLASRYASDLIVMATHGRRGFSRVLLGSVAEMVLREAPCPVLCVRRSDTDKNLVGAWMTTAPVTATPEEKLSSIQARMQQGNFHSIPVVDNGHLAGLVTHRGIWMHAGYIDSTEAKSAMEPNPLTVTSNTPLHDASRLMLEHKLESLPVLEDGIVVGILTSSDIMRAFMQKE